MILGTVSARTLKRLHDELLQPLVARVFGIMTRNGLILPPAKGLDNNGLQVEFISILARRRRRAALSAASALHCNFIWD